MKVCFETFGCRLNRAEALQREAEYLAKGWEVTTVHKEADLFIVRGCSVTHRAQHDCKALIAHLKKHYAQKPIVVEGCLPDELKKASSRAVLAENPLATPTRTARAYLKVQDGCAGKCAFCIVPQFRGASKSVPWDDALAKAQRFIDAGYHEIVVTGCNLALYASQGKRLPELLAALAALSPDTRIRLGSVEPGPCAREVVDAFVEHTNICRFLHLPVQSGSNRILLAMKRPYLTKDIDEIVQYATKRLPLIGLGCDLMTGFPGETEVDFLATQGLLKRHAFSNSHIFPYSERPNTLAAGLPFAVDPKIRHERAHKLSDQAAHLRSKAAQKHIGKDVEVLIEDEKKLTGWTGEYFACEITNKTRGQAIHRKELIRVHVMTSHHGHLKAVLV